MYGVSLSGGALTGRGERVTVAWYKDADKAIWAGMRFSQGFEEAVPDGGYTSVEVHDEKDRTIWRDGDDV